MLTRIRLASPDGYLANMHTSVDPTQGGFLISDVDGLGPAPANIAYTDHAMIDGGVFHSSRGDVRNLVVTVKLESGYSEGSTPKDLRRQLYLAAPPKSLVHIRLYEDDVLTYLLTGYVETHEPSIFTKDPEVQISILCTEPYLRSWTSNSLEDLSWTTNIEYDGTAPWGFIMNLQITSESHWIEVQNRSIDPIPTFRLFNYAYEAGQQVRLVTSPGSKDATLRSSDGSWIRRLIGRFEIEDGWPYLKPGNNEIRVRAPLGYDNPVYDISWRERYAGF